MSLEIALQETTAAIHLLIAALTSSPTSNTHAQAPVANNSASSTAEDSLGTKPEAAAQETAKGSHKTESSQSATEAEGVSYDQAAAAIQTLAKSKGRDTAIAILKKFGAAKLPDVEPKDFAAIVAACEAA